MGEGALDSHVLRFDYFNEHTPLGHYGKATLRFYLKGKPDSDGWRESFRDNQMTPVSYEGNIYPRWALLDLYKLLQIQPKIEEDIIPEGMNIEDFPPLEAVVTQDSEGA